MSERLCAYCAKPLAAGHGPDEHWHQACFDEARAKKSPPRKPGYVPDSWTWVHPKEKRGRKRP
jgi:hypothetical protein